MTLKPRLGLSLCSMSLLLVGCRPDPISVGPSSPPSAKTQDGHGHARDPSWPPRELAPFSGPCSVKGEYTHHNYPYEDELTSKEFALQLGYDEHQRVVNADILVRGDHLWWSWTEWTSWTETWSYDGDHLVRHEVTLDQEEISDLPRPWNDLCFLDGAPPSRFEEWTYDDLGRVASWTMSGWGSAANVCTPSVREEYEHMQTGVSVRRWERSWADIRSQLPHQDCLSGSSEQSCPERSRPTMVEAWRAALPKLLTMTDLGSPTHSHYEHSDAGLVRRASGDEPELRLEFGADGLPQQTTKGECAVIWNWELDEQGRPIEQDLWVFEWEDPFLSAIASYDRENEPSEYRECELEFEEEEMEELQACEESNQDYAGSIESRVTLELDPIGKIERAEFEQWTLEFDYACEGGKGPSNPGWALAVMLDLSDPTRFEIDKRKPWPLFQGWDIGLPMAAPGLWGTGPGFVRFIDLPEEELCR